MQDKVYDPEKLKAIIANIDMMIPLLEKQVALYKQMRAGFQYQLEKAKK